jgi:hypothetical protein
VSGAAPLHLAASKAALPAVQLLLASGADPNVRNAKGWGAVHVAASGGSLDVVLRLVAGEASAVGRAVVCLCLLCGLMFMLAVVCGCCVRIRVPMRRAGARCMWLPAEVWFCLRLVAGQRCVMGAQCVPAVVCGRLERTQMFAMRRAGAQCMLLRAAAVRTWC